MKTFEECLPQILEEIVKRKNRWQQNFVVGLDFDEVTQLILVHVHQKWDLWDQSRPFKNWLNTVITNKIKNLFRDNFANLAPPCRTCPMNQGGSLCSFTASGEKGSECPSYAEWSRSKRSGYELRSAASIDNPDEQASFALASPQESFDLERSIARFSIELKKVLSKTNYLVFDLLFIKQHSEEEVAEILGFTTSEKGRRAGYKQIYNIRKKILEESKKILAEREIFYE